MSVQQISNPIKTLAFDEPIFGQTIHYSFTGQAPMWRARQKTL